MTYKTIAVALDTGAHATQRLDAAVGLAERFDAHLRGLYSDLTLDPRFYYQARGEHRYGMTLQELCRERRACVEHQFLRRLAGSRVAHDWLANEMNTGYLLYEHARCADLTIVGQHDEAKADASFADRYPERTIMAAGGHVLVWPRGHASCPLDGAAVIAWDGSREAARAVFDALPLLRHAVQVDIVSIHPEPDGAPTEEGAALAPDLARSLMRHAVSANVVALRVSGEGCVPSALLSYLQAERPRVLVMGAFHHSRLRETFLGGLTRAMLRDADLPVLMSN
ncbi:universal stress protein [Caballeronia sp. RCC_10]|uniref:universal stress protein n=1 Tax=Caballeronia sp. RCC_10 TaxID=3239227 RepID=UPI003524B623